MKRLTHEAQSISITLCIKTEGGAERTMKICGYTTGEGSSSGYSNLPKADYFNLYVHPIAFASKRDVQAGVLLGRKIEKTVDLAETFKLAPHEYSVLPNLEESVGVLLKVLSREV